MSVTLLEVGAQYGAPMLKQGVAKVIAQNSPVLDRIRNKQFSGNAYQFQMESAIPLGQWRAVGGTYTRGSGSLIKVTENVSILGSEVFVDNFELKVSANKKDLKARKFQEISRGLALTYDTTFFNGNSLVNPLQFDGLRSRITGNQLLSASVLSGGGSTLRAPLTLAYLDQLLDLVIAPDKILYMNRTLRRKITSLAQSATGTIRVERPSLDAFGKQVQAYNEVPILLVERTDDGSSILDFTEDPGDGTANSASIYCVSYGDEERVFGLLGAGGDLEAHQVGDESQVAPGIIGRVEFYPGMAIAHPRCVGRLRAVQNA